MTTTAKTPTNPRVAALVGLLRESFARMMVAIRANDDEATAVFQAEMDAIEAAIVAEFAAPT